MKPKTGPQNKWGSIRDKNKKRTSQQDRRITKGAADQRNTKGRKPTMRVFRARAPAPAQHPVASSLEQLSAFRPLHLMFHKGNWHWPPEEKRPSGVADEGYDGAGVGGRGVEQGGGVQGGKRTDGLLCLTGPKCPSWCRCLWRSSKKKGGREERGWGGRGKRPGIPESRDHTEANSWLLVPLMFTLS